jgi:hypothetical protein
MKTKQLGRNGVSGKIAARIGLNLLFLSEVLR